MAESIPFPRVIGDIFSLYIHCISITFGIVYICYYFIRTLCVEKKVYGELLLVDNLALPIYCWRYIKPLTMLYYVICS